MKKYLLLLALGASAALYSCDSDDDQPVNPGQMPVTTTPTDTVPKITYLLAKNWRIAAFTQGAPGSTAHSDLFNSGFPNCEKDDIYVFTQANNVLTVRTGNNKCSSTETDKTGTWDLNNDSSVLTITNPSQTYVGLTGPFSVVEIKPTRMMITRVLNGSQYTITFNAI